MSLAKKITHALINSGLLRTSEFTAASRIIREQIRKELFDGQQQSSNRDHGTATQQAKAFNPTPLDPKGDGSFEGPDGA